MTRWVRAVAVLPIAFYRRFLSPLKPRTCRFHPTCSAYAQKAIQVHGVLRGTLLGVWRILRCNPFGGKGYDPVPRNPREVRADAADDAPPPSPTP